MIHPSASPLVRRSLSFVLLGLLTRNQVDNNQFGGQWSLIIHESRSGQAWTPLGDSPVLEPSERARKNIESRLDRPEPQEAVFPVDLDEHLEDITKDWLNLDFTLD